MLLPPAYSLAIACVSDLFLVQTRVAVQYSLHDNKEFRCSMQRNITCHAFDLLNRGHPYAFKPGLRVLQNGSAPAHVHGSMDHTRVNPVLPGCLTCTAVRPKRQGQTCISIMRWERVLTSRAHVHQPACKDIPNTRQTIATGILIIYQRSRSDQKARPE